VDIVALALILANVLTQKYIVLFSILSASFVFSKYVWMLIDACREVNGNAQHQPALPNQANQQN
jgi:hypothetical protein